MLCWRLRGFKQERLKTVNRIRRIVAGYLDGGNTSLLIEARLALCLP